MQQTTQTTTTTVVSGKSILVAYLLWFFLGSLGIHRFYLGRTGTAITQLIMAVLGVATLFIILGDILLPILGIWLVIDLFLIPGMVRTAPAGKNIPLYQTQTTTTTTVEEHPSDTMQD